MPRIELLVLSLGEESPSLGELPWLRRKLREGEKGRGGELGVLFFSILTSFTRLSRVFFCAIEL